MLYTKDGLTTEKFIELLQYSLEPECQFLSAINIANDLVIQNESVIRFFKMAENKNVDLRADGSEIYSYRFSVKVLVEDKYWAKHPDPDNENYYKSETVPSHIHNHVNKILNG